jgi:starvation-inducible outer membrane lipoprotein
VAHSPAQTAVARHDYVRQQHTAAASSARPRARLDLLRRVGGKVAALRNSGDRNLAEGSPWPTGPGAQPAVTEAGQQGSGRSPERAWPNNVHVLGDHAQSPKG